MKHLCALLLAVALSLGLYLTTFAFVVHKPLTVGVMRSYFTKKTAVLAAQRGRKVVILAGSNGRFSHRAETIGTGLGLPCVNMSIAANISLPFQVERLKPYLAAHDVVYLPLEYRTPSFAPDSVGGEGPYVMAYERRSLALFHGRQRFEVLFYFDGRFLLSALGEMALAARGYERRFSVNTVSAWGDETGHSAAKGQAYASYLRTLPQIVVAPEPYESDRDWQDVIAFLEWATAQRVVVIGGLPTTFEDTVLPPVVVSYLERLYTSRGHYFVALPNRSLYPRSSFFDTPYHLCEEAMAAHSQQLVPALAAVLSKVPAAPPPTAP